MKTARSGKEPPFLIHLSDLHLPGLAFWGHQHAEGAEGEAMFGSYLEVMDKESPSRFKDIFLVGYLHDLAHQAAPPGIATPAEAPPSEIECLSVECEVLKAQVIEHQFQAIEAKRRAEQADERVDELLSQHANFLDLVKRLEATNKDIQRGLDAQRTGKPCLHDKNEGYVSRQLDDEHVAIEFETSDGRVVEQVHHRDQFIDGKLPREGDGMEAHVLAWFRPPEPADASKYLTPEELEHGFPGFQKAIERRRKEEQANRT